MKKINSGIKIYYLGIVAVIIVSAGLVLVQNKATAVSSNNSVIKASWSMDMEKQNYIYLGADDSSDAGAQFIPSGKYQESKRIAVCSIIAVPDGGQQLNDISNSIFYPEEIYLGPSYSKEQKGCGQLIEQNQMVRLNKNIGIDLFCNKIKNYNNNLPVFNSALENYDKFCEANGELENETSAVFRGEKDLLYDDPSGIYQVNVTAQDNGGNINYQESEFTYLPFTAFEMDFDSIEYGAVREGRRKIVNGDLVWGNGVPTIRNVGNTRLSIEILQEGMGLDDIGKSVNVEYGAKIGENEKSWVFFNEGIKQKINSSLNLSEKNEIDFSVFVYKFPMSLKNRFNGNFTLSAVFEDHLKCDAFVAKEIYLTSTHKAAPVDNPYPSADRVFVPAISYTPVPTPIPLVTPDPLKAPETPILGGSSSPASISPVPTVEPSSTPTVLLDISPAPSIEPTLTPSVEPTVEPTPTPSLDPTPTPETSPEPTISPTPSPSSDPTSTPTISPEASTVPTPTLSPELVVTPSPEPFSSPEPTPGPPSAPESSIVPTPSPDVSPASIPTPDSTPSPNII
jgi:hypothetical protein